MGLLHFKWKTYTKKNEIRTASIIQMKIWIADKNGPVENQMESHDLNTGLGRNSDPHSLYNKNKYLCWV